MDDLEVTQEPIVTEEPVTPVVATGADNEIVDTAPDPVSLQAEIERLRQVKEEAARIAKEAEEKALYWRKQKAEERANYFKSRGEEPPQPIPPPAQDLGIGAEPKQETFDDYQKYLDAKIAYEVNKAKVTWDRDQARKQNEQAYKDKMAKFQEKLDQGYQQYADFEEIAKDPTVAITPMMVDIMADSERPQDIAYYLGRNKAEAIAIARMTPFQAARAITKIEMELPKAGDHGGSPSIPKLPSAPPPIKPLGSSHTVEKPLEKMTQKEFEAEMERRTKRRF